MLKLFYAIYIQFIILIQKKTHLQFEYDKKIAVILFDCNKIS